MGRKVAIYARVSTEHEAQINALENQIQYYDNKLSEHPDWELYDRYIDEGITGTSVNKRKNFMRMLKDAEKGCFDLIITREVSRFARNTVDTLLETRKLKKMGVEVYFTEDNIWTFKDEDGELKLTLMATLAQNESKKTSMRVKAGQKISFQNGVYYGSGNIMGYDRVGKDAVVNEDQAKIVRLIFQLFLEGKGVTKIKYELEQREIPTATGLKVWNVATISRMLQNSFYCGTVVYNKEFTADYLEQKKRKNHGEVEQTIVEGKHVPIISKEDFEAVQKLIKKHSIYLEDGIRKKLIGSPRNIWSQKLICNCGSRFNRRVYSGAGTDHQLYSYYCYRQKNEGSARKRKELGLDYEGFCDVVQINEWKLELMFSVLLKNLIKNKDKLRTIAKTAIESSALVETDNNEILNEIKEINIKLTTNKSRLDKLLNAYLDNILTNEEYSSKRKELEDTIITLENRLKELEENSKNQSISVKDKINILKQKVDMLLDIDTNEISDVLIDSIVDKITVHNDRYEWKVNYISSSSEENDENSNGVFFARMIITVDEIKRYNDKKKILKKVFQKDPIVMDIYI